MIKKGFTFIEILITLTVVAICFLPLMRMFSLSIQQVYVNEDLTTARYLAQEGMERIKNLGFTEEQLKNLGNFWKPSLDKPPLELNGRKWRILSKFIPGTDPLRVEVWVYHIRDGRETEQEPVVKLVTLVEDLDWPVLK